MRRPTLASRDTGGRRGATGPANLPEQIISDDVSNERAMERDDAAGRSRTEQQYRGSPGIWRGGGGGFGLPMGGGGLGIGTVVVLRPDRLGARHRSAAVDRRRRNGFAGRFSYQPPVRQRTRRTGAPSDDMGRFVSPCSATPTPSGPISLRKTAGPTASPCWCYSSARPRAVAAWRRARWGRSIARTIRRSIRTPRSSMKSRRGFMAARGAPASSRRPM